MERIYVVPKEGYLIRDPRSKLVLPREGKEVVRSRFWMRRIKAGDVTETKAVLKTQSKLPKTTSKNEVNS